MALGRRSRAGTISGQEKCGCFGCPESAGRNRATYQCQPDAVDLSLELRCCSAAAAAVGISVADARKRTLNEPHKASLTPTGQALPVRDVGDVRREHVDRLSTLLH